MEGPSDLADVASESRQSAPAPPAGPESWFGALLGAAIIAVAAVIAYANSFSGMLVFDDEFWIVQNSSVHRLWPIWSVLFPARAAAVGGRPLVNLTVALNYAAGGVHVWGYHAVNLIIHILAACTLFGIVRRTLSLPKIRDRFRSAATPLALAIALLWTVHPLQTAAVTYIIQRTESLVSLFYLLTLYCVIRGAASAQSAGNWYMGATLSCLLGMLTKEVMATAPLIVLLYDRTFLSGSFRQALSARLKLYLSLAATWAVIPWVLISTGFHNGSTGGGAGGFTYWTYLLTQPGVLLHYLGQVFWPTGLSLDWGWPAVHTLGTAVLPGLLIVALLGLTVWALVKRPALGFLGAWFFVILAPTSSFVPVRDAAFDHRVYLPLAAIAVAVVLASYSLCGRLFSPATGEHAPATRLPAAVLGIALLAVAVALGWGTVERNALYASDVTIWQDAVEKNPDHSRSHLNLGVERLDRARGRTAEAISDYEQALTLKPDLAEAHCDLGLALSAVGRTPQAIDHLRQAVAIDPNYVDAKTYLACLLANTGDSADAMELCYRALTIDPDNATAHNNLGHILEGVGQREEAIKHYRRALASEPEYPEAHFNLGLALDRIGQPREAIPHLLAAVRLKPDEVAYLSTAALALAVSPDKSVRDPTRALEFAKRANDLTGGKDPGNLNVLANAYAEARQFPLAVTIARQALALAELQHKDSLAAVIRGEIPQYEAHQSAD